MLHQYLAAWDVRMFTMYLAMGCKDVHLYLAMGSKDVHTLYILAIEYYAEDVHLYFAMGL